MNDDFLGSGWAFPVAAGPDQASIVMASHEDSIRQSIWMILGTAPGERVMRPDFGCGIQDMVFAVNSAGTAGQVASLVRQALIRWEPRIDLLNVSAIADATTPNLLTIDIVYQVRSTNSRFNLVYPFYLE